MSTLTTQLSYKNNFINKVILVLVLGWMSLYPIYTNYYDGLAIEQVDRHLHWKANESMFYNPWQYRVFSPLLVEAVYQLLDHTVFSLIEVKGMNLDVPGESDGKYATTQQLLVKARDPIFIKYTVAFVGVRVITNLLVYVLAYFYFSLFVRNKPFIIFSLLPISLFMGNAINECDLTVNTYVDVILYLWAGIVIVKKHNPWWIVLITAIGAFNRETSLLIPVLFYCAKIDYTTWPNAIKMAFAEWKYILITACSLMVFVAIFAGIRMYYGYVPPEQWRVSPGWPMIKLNLLSAVSIKTYMEMYGVFGFLPLVCVVFFSRLSLLLKVFFVGLVPVWFFIHFWSVVSYQSRLFLVPSLLIFMPAVMELIDRVWEEKDISV